MATKPTKNPIVAAWRYFTARGSTLRTARFVYQIISLALFGALVAMTTETMMGDLPVSLFLHLDPLAAVVTVLGTGVLFGSMVLALVTIGATLLFGRVFCSFVCPLGIMNHLVGFLGRRKGKDAEAINRSRPWYGFKYGLLLGGLLATLLGVNLLGLLDPISLTTRAFGTVVLPGMRQVVPSLPTNGVFVGTWLIGGLFLAVIVLNLVVPRLFCRALCPLGALLGLLSRFSLFRIHRDVDKCIDCGACTRSCAGACSPDGTLQQSDCLACMSCIPSCPTEALSYRFMPPKDTVAEAPRGLTRRGALGALAGGVIGAMAGTVEASTSRELPQDFLRPPGSQDEPGFLDTCISCGACMKVCPTNVIQPAGLEGGIVGLWTPRLDMTIGYCEVTCTLCGSVCPTGAIAPLTVEARTGPPPLKLGTAYHDVSQCLPYAYATPCAKCEEYCPTSPKAIVLDVETITIDGELLPLEKPRVVPERCVGCGSCANACPVPGKAVHVLRADESRSPGTKLFM